MDVNPWRDSLFPASGTDAPTPVVTGSRELESGELQGGFAVAGVL